IPADRDGSPRRAAPRPATRRGIPKAESLPTPCRPKVPPARCEPPRQPRKPPVDCNKLSAISFQLSAKPARPEWGRPLGPVPPRFGRSVSGIDCAVGARQLNTGNCPVCNTRVCARMIPPFFRLGFGDIFYRTKPISYKDFVVIVLHAIHSISDQVWGNCSREAKWGSGALLKARNSFVNDPAGYSGRTPLGECGGPLVPDVRIARRRRGFG